jgi:hypothetical protein
LILSSGRRDRADRQDGEARRRTSSTILEFPE